MRCSLVVLLLKQEAAFGRGLVEALLSRQNLVLYLTVIVQSGERCRNLQRRRTGRENDAELHLVLVGVLHLDDDLVVVDRHGDRRLDAGTAAVGIGVRHRHRIPGDGDRGAAHDGRVESRFFFVALPSLDRAVHRRRRRRGHNMGQLDLALQLLAVEREALDLVLSRREAAEEIGRVELVEGRLGALEEDLGEALPP